MEEAQSIFKTILEKQLDNTAQAPSLDVITNILQGLIPNVDSNTVSDGIIKTDSVLTAKQIIKIRHVFGAADVSDDHCKQFINILKKRDEPLGAVSKEKWIGFFTIALPKISYQERVKIATILEIVL